MYCKVTCYMYIYIYCKDANKKSWIPFNQFAPLLASYFIIIHLSYIINQSQSLVLTTYFYPCSFFTLPGHLFFIEAFHASQLQSLV